MQRGNIYPDTQRKMESNLVNIVTGKIAVFTAVLLTLSACGGGETPDSQTLGEEAVSVSDTATSDAANAVDNAVADVTEATGEGWNQLQGNWQDSIAGIKDQWSELTEEELLQVNGDRDQLVTLVQSKYGLDRDTAESEVDEWASTQQ